MKLEFLQQFKKKYIKFHENLFSGNRVVPREKTDGRTDKHDETKSVFAILWTRLKCKYKHSLHRTEIKRKLKLKSKITNINLVLYILEFHLQVLKNMADVI